MLELLLYPKSIAIIGASRTPGKVGHEILVNILDGGLEGQIVPVNPSADEILGLKCLHDLNAYTGSIDLSVIAVPEWLPTGVRSIMWSQSSALLTCMVRACRNVP